MRSLNPTEDEHVARMSTYDGVGSDSVGGLLIQLAASHAMPQLLHCNVGVCCELEPGSFMMGIAADLPMKKFGPAPHSMAFTVERACVSDFVDVLVASERVPGSIGFKCLSETNKLVVAARAREAEGEPKWAASPAARAKPSSSEEPAVPPKAAVSCSPKTPKKTPKKSKGEADSDSSAGSFETGTRVKVFWTRDRKYYYGEIYDMDPAGFPGHVEVLYDDESTELEELGNLELE